jgi:3-isopropylmalate/(R)-2-methylmalate dehydratase small subunit
MDDIFKGRVAWVFGDDFDIDLVIGVTNIKYYDPDKLRSVLMKAYDPTFVDEVRPGDVLVGGRNFGYGHPHYPAMIAMRNAGIVAVVAESYAPGFWRGELYQGMPLVTVPGIAAAVERWDDVEVDWRAATVRVGRTGEVLQGTPPSPHAIDVIQAGGGLNLLRAQYGPSGTTPPPAAAAPATAATSAPAGATAAVR